MVPGRTRLSELGKQATFFFGPIKGTGNREGKGEEAVQDQRDGRRFGKSTGSPGVEVTLQSGPDEGRNVAAGVAARIAGAKPTDRRVPDLLSQKSPRGASIKPEDLEKLRRAYQSGAAEKQKGISEFAALYGLKRYQVYWIAFKNGFTGLGRGNSKLHLPSEAEKILQQAAGLGRRAAQAAINRVMRVLWQYPRAEFGHVTRALLWRISRKYKRPLSQHRRYERARWSPADVELLRRGYAEGGAGIRRAVRELLRRHPDWSPRQIHYKAQSLGLGHRELEGNAGKALKPWSQSEEMALISKATHKPAKSIGATLDRSRWAVRCRLAGLDARSRVSGQDYGSEDLIELLHVGRRMLQRLIGSKKLKATNLHISRRSVEEFLRNRGSPGKPRSSARRAPLKKYYTVHKAAARLGMRREDVEGLLAKGVLKPYRPRVSEENLWKFLEKHGWQLQRDALEFESLDEEPQRWVKPAPSELTPAQRALLAKLQAQRKHTERVNACRYCGRQFSGNVYAFHEKRCPQRPKAQLGPQRLEQAARASASGGGAKRTYPSPPSAGSSSV